MESTARAPGTSSLHRALWIALALAPLAYLAVDLAVFAVDVPLWDSWEFVPLLQKHVAGTLTWHDVWNQHNQHRLLFPKLVLLALASASHWSSGVEMAFQVLQALAAYLVLVRVGGNFAREVCGKAAPELPAILSLLVFSQTQSENWVCGWQIQIWMSVAASTCGLLLLSRPPWTAGRLLGAIALGVVASYSFGTGILYWPLGLAVLVLARDEATPLRPRLVVWALASALVLGAYAHGYHENADAYSRLGRSWTLPVLGAYVLKFLGAAVVSRDHRAAMAVGVVGLGTLAGVPWVLARRRGVALAALAPWLALGGTGVLAALLTGVGRAGFGAKMGMESRYVTLSTPFWCANAVLLATLARAPAPKAERRVPRVLRWLPPLVLGAVVALAARSSLVEARAMREDTEKLQVARAIIRGERPLDLLHLQAVYTPYLCDVRTGLPTPAFGRLWSRIEWLRARKLAACRR